MSCTFTFKNKFNFAHLLKKVLPFTLLCTLYHFWQKRYPFCVTPVENGTPFTYLQCQTKKVGTLPRLPLNQSAKKFVSNSWGLVDFSIRQVNSVLNLPNQQVKCFGTFKLRKNFNQSCSSPKKFGLVKTTLGLKMLAVAYPSDNFPSHRVECTGQIIF